MKIFLLAVSLFAATTLLANGKESKLFEGYLGEWKGTFRVYSADGQLIKTMDAHHIYKRIDANRIEGEQTIKYSDGTIEKVKATDLLKDGKLTCTVESNLYGRKVLGGHVDGDQIFWSRQEKDVIESFRERVNDNGNTYAIDGYGIYGADRGKIYTFVGEYKRIRKSEN
jgi:hypothetical protein